MTLLPGDDLLSPAGDDSTGEALAEINTTPLIDVLLVLLIMLMVTVPASLHHVETVLAPGEATVQTPPPVVSLRIDDDGGIWWNDQAVDGLASLEERLQQLAGQPQAELHLRAGDATRWEPVATVLAAIRRHGITRFGLEGLPTGP